MQNNNGKYYIVLLNDDMGGAERVAINYVNFLSQSFDNTEVTVCYLDNKKYGYAVKESDNINVWRSKFSSSFLGLIQLAFKLNSEKCVHQVFSSHILTNSFMSLFKKLKIFKSDYLIGRESTVASDRFTGIKKVIIDVLYKFYGCHDLLICQTSYMKSELLRHRGKYVAKKCEVIDNPINSELFERTFSHFNSTGTIKVISIGRLIPVKNFERLIHSVSIFQQAIDKPVEFSILGDGPLFELLNKNAEQYDNIKVIFHGKVQDPYLIMSQADIGIISSIKEGFPNVLLEMMACGVPKIISTPCADGIDALTNVHITTGFEVVDLSQSLINIFNQPSASENQYQNCLSKRTIESFHQKINSYL
jgi:glycosyltransferase involved in cell wall biosynthesis